VTKVSNAQYAGASFVLVVDSFVEPVTNIVMGDDGFGFTVQVPSALIGAVDGKILADYITKS
jgi:hypothetical protein